MKVAHKKMDMATQEQEAGRQLEKDGSLDEAAAVYEQRVKKDPLDEAAYNRLMIIYRKMKDYKKELAAIKKGMAAFDESFRTSSRLPKSRKITLLSKSLLKSLGLTDRKGNAINTREPLNRWSKRKLVVERLLKKQNKRS